MGWDGGSRKGSSAPKGSARTTRQIVYVSRVSAGFHEPKARSKARVLRLAVHGQGRRVRVKPDDRGHYPAGAVVQIDPERS